MGIFDLIAELKKDPKPERVAKGMYFLAAGCVAGGLWNYLLISQLEDLRRSPFSLPDYFPLLALGVYLLLGLMFFLAGRGIRERAPWGRRLGQISLVLALAAMAGSSGSIGIPEFRRMQMVFALVMFGIPTVFGVLYLGRLPVKSDGFIVDPPDPNGGLSNLVDGDAPSSSPLVPGEAEKYHDSLVPFGLIGTIGAMALGMLAVFVLADQYLNQVPELMFPAFLLVFLSLIAANYLPSPFQRKRKLIASFTGGGGTWYFNGSIPFVRLMVYADGVELRIALQRYFIPYKKMSPPEKKASFFSTGLVIDSDLPGVPSRLKFVGIGMAKIVKTVRENYDQRDTV